MFGAGIIAIIFVGMNRQPEKPKDPRDTARYACREFVLKTLADPDAARMDDSDIYFAEAKRDGTILVQPRGRVKNAFNAYVFGSWNCLVKNDGKNIRLISLEKIR